MRKKIIIIIISVLVAFLTYFPTVAEILCAKHVALFGFFIPFIKFPNYWTNQGYSSIVYWLALPFALLKGICWGIVLYGINALIQHQASKRSRKIVFAVIILAIAIALLDLGDSLGMLFMWAAASTGF